MRTNGRKAQAAKAWREKRAELSKNQTGSQSQMRATALTGLNWLY